ncbi:MAG: hypothetical protein RM338_03575, partial [Nostoc sp. DedQUE12a]|nr:hypothetical protein [Nostoc sp. DedQUE12a]
SILLAISPDNQILYIDRSFGIPQPQHWNPPFHLRNANPDFRLEFITASFDSTYKNSDRSEASTALKALIPAMLIEYSL